MDKNSLPRNFNIAWLEDIPRNWTQLCAKYMFRILNGSTPKSNEPSYWDGEINWATPNDLGALEGDTIFETARKLTRIGYENSGTTLVPPGSLILSTRAPIGHTAIAGVELCTNQGCRTLVFKNSDDTRYFFYQLLAAKPILQALGRGTTFVELNSSALSDFKLVRPPLAQQRAIASFLDRETAIIDRLIAKKQELIQRLHEKRTALISHTVTKGLDPNAPMKDSGIEWLGQIPTHWQTIRSKWLFTVRTERARPDDIQLSATQAYGVISQEEYMRREERQVTQITQHLDQRRHVEIDDFVISMRSFQGGLERAWETGCIRSSYVVLQPSSQIVVDFFTYLFKSSPYIQALRATSNFLRDGQDMNFNNFALVDLPVIPLSEQEEIAAFLDEETRKIDALVEKSNQFIELLKEYRTTLISAAVTGKIDVRNHRQGEA